MQQDKLIAVDLAKEPLKRLKRYNSRIKREM